MALGMMLREPQCRQSAYVVSVDNCHLPALTVVIRGPGVLALPGAMLDGRTVAYTPGSSGDDQFMRRRQLLATSSGPTAYNPAATRTIIDCGGNANAFVIT